jgi:hypothetical protein
LSIQKQKQKELDIVEIELVSRNFSSTHLKCLYTNATSLNNKINKLILDIIDHDVSVVFISKTWWSDTSAVNINGFNLFRKDRDSRGGGVCIYIRNSLKSYIIDVELLCSNLIEQIWCIVDLGSERIICGCIYRPGSSSNLENLAIIRLIKQVSCLYI